MSKNKKLGGLERFRLWIEERDLDYSPVMLDDAATTSEQSANALGCSVAQIAKSLIFRLAETDLPLLIIASGANRVDEKRIANRVGSTLNRADATFVREQTGYAIGGVPPFAHVSPLKALIDEDLQVFDTIWAAAGHPKSVFKLKPTDLIDLTGGQVVQLKL